MKKNEFADMEAKFKEIFGDIDVSIVVVLQCHLLIEQQLDQIIEKFVFHPKYIAKANLRYHQKIEIARSISLDSHENPMWDIPIKLNNLRNDFAHLLESPKRAEKLRLFRDIYFREMMGLDAAEEHKLFDDLAIIMLATGHFMGFLRAFDEEVTRFKGFISTIDPIVNPHRYSKTEDM